MELESWPEVVQREEPAGEAVEPGDAAEQPTVSLEDLSQEIRRVGRELFKTNRASERNQELFEASLEELRRLTTVVAQIPAQAGEPVFEAKASLCRELLGVADALEASVTAGRDVLARLRGPAEQPVSGMLSRFATVRQLQEALADSVALMSQWREGQELLYQRLAAALHGAGLRPIEAVGRAFDPALHRAVSVAQRRDVAAGTVVGEELKGYLLDGRVLRYAEVVVVRDE